MFTIIHIHPNTKYTHTLLHNPQRLFQIIAFVQSPGSNYPNQVKMKILYCTSSTIHLNMKACELKRQVICLPYIQNTLFSQIVTIDTPIPKGKVEILAERRYVSH